MSTSFRLPAAYFVVHSVLVFIFSFVILAIDINNKVVITSMITQLLKKLIDDDDTVGLSPTQVLTATPDFTATVAVCSYLLVMAVGNIVLVRLDNQKLLQLMNVLHFTATFLSMLLWIPRIDLIKLLNDLKVRVPVGTFAIVHQYIAILVLGLLDTILCFAYFVLTSIHIITKKED